MRAIKRRYGLTVAAGYALDPLERRALLSLTPVTVAMIGGADGQPSAQVAVDAAGDAFGTTASSGTSAGTIFEVPAGSTTVRTIATFGDNNASNPLGINPNHIVIDAAGTLFGDSIGVTGVLWELPAGTSTPKTIAAIGIAGDYGDPLGPATALQTDPGGDLFANFTFTYPSGPIPTVLRFAAGTWDETPLTNGIAASHYPHLYAIAPFAVDESGDAYVGYVNPVEQSGVDLFKFPPGAGTGTADGTVPGTAGTGTANAVAGLAADAAGDVFVTTPTDAVYEVSADGVTATRVAALDGTTNGTGFVGTPVVDAAGDLFAVTSGGGAHGDGTLVELPAGAKTFTVLESFDQPRSAAPVGGLLLDGVDGLMYSTVNGTTLTVFKIPAASLTVSPTPTPTPAPTAPTQLLTPGLLPALVRSTLPTTAVLGVDRGTVRLTLRNTTDTVERGSSTVGVYLVPAGTTNAASGTLVGQVRRSTGLKAGGLATVNVPLRLPALDLALHQVAGLTPGTYTMAFRVTDAAGHVTSVNGGAVTVTAPTLALDPSVSAVARRRSAIVTVTVAYGGNITAVGKLTVDVQLQPGPTRTVVRRVAVRPGHRTVIRFRASGLTTGTTYAPTIAATFTPAKAVGTFTGVGTGIVSGSDVTIG